MKNTRELEIRRGPVKPLVMMTVVVLCLTSQLEDFSSHNLFLIKEFVVQILQFVTKHIPKYNHKLFSYVESTVLISTFLKKLVAYHNLCDYHIQDQELYQLNIPCLYFAVTT